ncbi:MAG: hypothetical protein MUQ56_03805 [Thermoleophilia bacterium]|nr:hypothetical protein [Thermoleophilia bacterium]
MSDWLPQLMLPRRAVAGYNVYFLVREGRCPVGAFVDSLKRGAVQTHGKVVNALRKVATDGLPQNEEQCKRHEDDLWYLKRGQPRLFFIIRGRNLYFLSAYPKKSARLDPREVKRARRIRDEYLKSLQEGMQ